MADINSPISVIPEDSAWGYLDSQKVGRLAVAAGDKPEIFPVNYCVDGESVVFRTAEGTKLERITENDHVSFEADGWNEDGGWSVVIDGHAETITDADELARAAKLTLLPWIPTRKEIFVRIVPSGEISGRGFVFGELPDTIA